MHDKVNIYIRDLPEHSFFNQILDTMADGLFTLDNNGRIISWNRAMEGITGYAAKEALGKEAAVLARNVHLT